MDSHRAFALIVNRQGEVLLCRRGLDLWNLPAGGVESGETPWDAVVREAAEEVGLIVEVEWLAGVYAKPKQEEIVFSFVCRVIIDEPTTSAEANEVAFFPVDQLPRNTSPKHVESVHDALDETDHAVLKVRAGPPSRDLPRSGKWPS